MYNSDILIDNISTLCRKRNISINQMLKEAQLAVSVIDNIKRGRVPSIDKIYALASYFNCSIDYLVGRTDNPNFFENNSEKNKITEQEYKILTAYRQNANMQQAVNKLLSVENEDNNSNKKC